MPIKIRGINVINNAFQLPYPLSPKGAIKGEKIKDIGVTIIVERIILIKPKLAPKKAPKRGPKTIEAIITGICKVVALIGPIGMKPRKGTVLVITKSLGRMRLKLAEKSFVFAA